MSDFDNLSPLGDDAQAESTVETNWADALDLVEGSNLIVDDATTEKIEQVAVADENVGTVEESGGIPVVAEAPEEAVAEVADETPVEAEKVAEPEKPEADPVEALPEDVDWQQVRETELSKAYLPIVPDIRRAQSELSTAEAALKTFEDQFLEEDTLTLAQSKEHRLLEKAVDRVQGQIDRLSEKRDEIGKAAWQSVEAKRALAGLPKELQAHEKASAVARKMAESGYADMPAAWREAIVRAEVGDVKPVAKVADVADAPRDESGRFTPKPKASDAAQRAALEKVAASNIAKRSAAAMGGSNSTGGDSTAISSTGKDGQRVYTSAEQKMIAEFPSLKKQPGKLNWMMSNFHKANDQQRAQIRSMEKIITDEVGLRN